MVIDADVEWCARVCRFLEPHGIPVLCAESVDAATAQLAQISTPAAVVLDSGARHQNGGAIATLRRQPALLGVPVGFVKKTAALDALLLMLGPGAAVAASHLAA
jgi:DNA-binding response OmpR family regulator